MGRFGIGARVRDYQNDEGVIVGKRKGERQMRYDDSDYGEIWWQKSKLTLIDAAEPAPTELQVGDRVRFVEDYGRSRTGDEGVITGFWDADSNPKGGVIVALDKGGTPQCYASRIEKIEPAAVAAPVVTPTTAAWVEAGKTYRDTDGMSVGPMIAFLDGFIEVAGDGRMWNPDGSAANEHAGLVAPLNLEVRRFYKTRDGRKVGPIGLSGHAKWPFDGVLEGSDSAFYEPDGNCPYLPNRNIVAEWVEPIAEPVTATTDEVAVKAFTGKGAPGDVVRCDAWDGTLFTAGRVYQFDATGEITSDTGSKFEAIHAGSWTFLRNETVEPVPTPERKFKVGDVVNYIDGKKQGIWQGVTITKDTGSSYHANCPIAGLGAFLDSWIELATDPAQTAQPVPTGSFIVARLTANGEPRPNVRPRVHASIEAAEQEAQRLADRLGDEFAVYQRVSSKTVDAGPVPEDFDLEQARLAETLKGAVQCAFVWARTKQGSGFWRDQRTTGLTHLGRAILKKWIAEAEAATTKEAA